MLSLPHHSFGNKLLFWPRRFLWARAVAALAGKSWEGGGAALAAQGWGDRRSAGGRRETAAPGRAAHRPWSAPPPTPLAGWEGPSATGTRFSAEPRALGLKALGQRRHGPLTPRSQRPTNTGLGSFPQLLTATVPVFAT